MKFKLLSLGLLSISALLPFAPTLTPAASAQCVMADISTQVAIHGSKEKAQQSNEVDQQSEGECVGNSIVHADTQTAITPGRATQTRTSNQRISGGQGNGTGVGMPPVKVKVYVPVDVYSPAHDPNFMGGVLHAQH